MSFTFDKPLLGARILVVEDDAILAFDLIHMLRDAGADIVGPGMTLKHALDLAATPSLICGVLDVSLRQELVFPVANVLRERGVGIVFYTGFGETHLLGRDWPNAQVLTKPATQKLLLSAIASACCGGVAPAT